MRIIILLTIATMILMGQLKSDTDMLIESKEHSFEINEEIISFYETKIKKGNFKSKEEERIFRNGYLGFLGYVAENEFPEYDKEFKETIDLED